MTLVLIAYIILVLGFSFLIAFNVSLKIKFLVAPIMLMLIFMSYYYYLDSLGLAKNSRPDSGILISYRLTYDKKIEIWVYEENNSRLYKFKPTEKELRQLQKLQQQVKQGNKEGAKKIITIKKDNKNSKSSLVFKIKNITELFRKN